MWLEHSLYVFYTEIFLEHLSALLNDMDLYHQDDHTDQRRQADDAKLSLSFWVNWTMRK